MRIGIEAQRIFRPNKHGMDYVVLQEILQLQQMNVGDAEFIVFVKPGEDRCVTSGGCVEVVELSAPTYPLWEQVALPRAARRYHVDLLHCTSNTAPLFTSVPLVLTLHDIIFLEPRSGRNASLYQSLGWWYRRFVVPRIVGRCRRVITVSEFERRNIASRLQLDSHHLRMIYNGYNEWFRPADDADRVYSRYIAQPDYLFFLGNTDPKKNAERTLIAYARYLEQSSVKRPLLIADLGLDYVSDVARRNGIEQILSHVVVPGYIANADLPSLYAHAFAFLYTSLRESFGIPLLEAMACGTPVVASNTSSIPEIAADSALFANPESADDIAARLLSLEADTGLYERLQKAGLKRAHDFSWRKTATELLALYRELYAELASEGEIHT